MKPRLKRLLAAITTLSVAPALPAAPVKSDPLPSPPNVLFIIFDDLNDCVEGLGGNPDALTPNLARLMRRGTTFLNAQTNAPLCSPSRASMLTGLYPHTARFFGSFDQDAPGGKEWYDMPVYSRSKTWVQYFKENSYDVFGTGKVYHQDAERWSDFTDSRGRRSYGQKTTFEPYPTDGGANPKSKKDGSLRLSVYPQQKWRGKLGYFAPLDEPPRFSKLPENPAGPAGWRVNGQPMHYRTDEDRGLTPDELSANYVEALLKEDREKPFFINVGFHRPHLPLVAPRRNFDRFPLDSITLPNVKADDLKDCAPLMLGDPGTRHRRPGFDKYEELVERGMLAKFTQAYLACVNFADEQLGQVLDALERSPHANNTIIIVTSDHGFHLGEKNWIFKFTVWEESCRIPLVIAGPGIAEGKRVAAPVSLVDIYPTLIDFSKLPADPHGSALPLDGHTLRPLLMPGEEETWSGPPVALTALANRQAKTNETPEALRGVVAGQIYSVRSEHFRYILCPDGAEELYDHRKDPNEWDNVAGVPEYAGIKSELRQEMERLVGEPLGFLLAR